MKLEGVVVLGLYCGRGYCMKGKINLVSGIVCVALLIRYVIIVSTKTPHTIFLHVSAVAAAIGIMATAISALKHKKQGS